MQARNDGKKYFDPIEGPIREGTRLELSADPAPGWEFVSWTGAVTGSYKWPILFPGRDTRFTAVFNYTGRFSSKDDFASLWGGGQGWRSAWTVVGTATQTYAGSILLQQSGSISRILDKAGGSHMGGGGVGGRGRFWRSGPVSEAPAMGIRTQRPLPKTLSEGGGLGEGLLGPYANSRASETGPDRQNWPRPPTPPPPMWLPPTRSSGKPHSPSAGTSIAWRPAKMHR